ncbi:hypothetical protein MD484_g563, partial [Candolleomyces efflorescens]
MFDPTPEELDLVADILLFTNTKESRILPTESAIDVFERSDLSREELREIWRLADKDRNGMLTSRELAVALRLIGWVQVGEPLSAHLIELPGPLPTLKGISDVEKKSGPAFAPPQFAPRKGDRSMTMPSHRTQPSPSSSSENVHVPPPPNPPIPLESARSEPLPEVVDQPNAIIGIPPASLENLTFLTSPSTRRKAGHSRGPSRSLTGPPQPPSSNHPPSPPPPPQPSPPPISGIRAETSVKTEQPIPEPPEIEIIPQAAVRPEEPKAPSRLPSPIEEEPESPAVPVEEITKVEEPMATKPEEPAPAKDEDASPDSVEIARLKALLEASQDREVQMEAQLKELETTMRQIMGANEEEVKGLESQLNEATLRISELDKYENLFAEASSNLEKAQKELGEARKEKDDEIQRLQETVAKKEEQISQLEQRERKAAQDQAEREKKVQTDINRSTAEKLRLSQRLEEQQRASDKEKAALNTRIQELEVLAADLQWSEVEHDLQHALEESAQEVDTLKVRLSEAEGKVARQQRDREMHEVEMSILQRQLVELRRENARMALANATNNPLPRSPGRSNTTDEPPPPAYDDAVLFHPYGGAPLQLIASFYCAININDGLVVPAITIHSS